jgi:acyl-CoA synthetase (AMP-forming)/AMP-acid ligase II
MIKDLADITIPEALLNDDALVDCSVNPNVTYTFKEIDTRVEHIASGLVHLNLPLESKLAILADNSVNFISLYLGIRRAGLVPVLINNKLSAEQIAKIIKHSDSELIFYEDKFVDKLPKKIKKISIDKELDALVSSRAYVPLSNDQERPAFFLYTSGTTGDPKGVVVSTKSRRWLVKRFVNPKIRKQVSLVAAPMYHMNGLSAVERTLVCASKVVLLPYFDAKLFAKAIEQHKVSMVTAVPPMLAMLLQDEELVANTDFSSVKFIALASAPTSPQLYKKIKNAFPGAVIIIRYGLTEVGPALFGPHPEKPTPEMSVGYPQSGIEYKLVDGVLHIKSPSMLSNYYKKTENFLTEDGFFNTKDKFTIDNNGFYFFAGRADDMFTCGGENIYPSEVEAIIESHPDVAEAAVIGVPDEIKGMKPCAFVVAKNLLTEDAVKKFVLDNAPAYQHPRRVWFIDKMPLTGTNKIDKKKLAEMAKE